MMRRALRIAALAAFVALLAPAGPASAQPEAETETETGRPNEDRGNIIFPTDFGDAQPDQPGDEGRSPLAGEAAGARDRADEVAKRAPPSAVDTGRTTASGLFAGETLWVLLGALALLIAAVAATVMMRRRDARRWTDAREVQGATKAMLGAMGSQVSGLHRQLEAIQATLGRQSQLLADLERRGAPPPSPAPLAYADDAINTAAHAPAPPPGPSPRSRALIQAFQPLLAGPPRRRPFDELFAHYGAAHSVKLSGDRITLARLDDDPEAYLVAIPDGGEHLVVPGIEYANNFGIQFNAAAQSPAVVSLLFKLEADGAEHLTLVEPARIAVDEHGSAEIISRGVLRGYAL